jgi:hypothetical protein
MIGEEEIFIPEGYCQVASGSASLLSLCTRIDMVITDGKAA